MGLHLLVVVVPTDSRSCKWFPLVVGAVCELVFGGGNLWERGDLAVARTRGPRWGTSESLQAASMATSVAVPPSTTPGRPDSAGSLRAPHFAYFPTHIPSPRPSS